MNKTKAKIGTFYSLQFLASKNKEHKKERTQKLLQKHLSTIGLWLAMNALVILIYFHLNICEKT
jgi:hypothetical protein